MRLTGLLLIFLFSNLTAEEPLAVYLTWQRSPQTTMTIHWISRNRDERVSFHLQSVANANTAEGISHPLPKNNSGLFIHTAEISELDPNSTYEFQIGDEEKCYKFKTLPTVLDEPIKFAAGGDMYFHRLETLEETNRACAKQDPRFVLAGGDLAYSADKFERWLQFLQSWQKTMVASDGTLIPILPVISNEDTKGGYGQTPEKAPFFYALFAMPGPQGYNVLDAGNYLSLFLLDSGHTHSVYGKQSHWLKHSLKKRQEVPHKIALYHVPAYPSVRSPWKKECQLIRMYWVPLFEEYRLSAAFENHDHAYKRTHPINKNRIDQKGVLYLGDGGWGDVKLRKPASPKERWYLSKTARERGFFLMTLNPDGTRKIQAFNHRGEVFDETIN